MNNYNENIALTRQTGGGIMGIKNQHMMARRERIRLAEMAKKRPNGLRSLQTISEFTLTSLYLLTDWLSLNFALINLTPNKVY